GSLFPDNPFFAAAAARSNWSWACSLFDPRLGRDQFLVKTAQPFREHPRAGKDRHEIRVAVPARDDVKMQMIGHACAGAEPKIQADVEALRLHRFAEQALAVHDEVPKLKD